VFVLAHLGITEPFSMLAWAAALLCVTIAVLRDRPRMWLGAGLAAGLGLEDNNLMLLLLIALAAGLLASRGQRRILATRWPWLGAVIALVIWLPNIVWQALNGWPEAAMASALHQDNSSAGAYILGVIGQLGYAGLLVIPLLIAGFVCLWRDPRARFLAIASLLLALYVIAWVPGKEYYSEGTGPMLLAAGAVAAERWTARGRRPKLRRALLIAAPALSMLLSLPGSMPVLPVAALHKVPDLDVVPTADTVGWPQLTSQVAALDASLTRTGQRPTSIFTGNYGEAGALDVLGTRDHLPPVLSGHNTFWLWGPGSASDRTVLVVDALSQLQPYFASCRQLATFHEPGAAPSSFNGLELGVCTGPSASWRAIWPHLRHYD
jgi:hypothetical protein